MTTRFSQQKPDPAVKKSVIKARSGVKGAKRIEGFVVATSLAATIAGWGLFSHEDAQVAVTAQQDVQTATAAAVQQLTPTATATATTSASIVTAPAAIAITRSSR